VLRVLGYSATRDLIPFYGVYALLFGDHGLSAGQISTLFVVWSVTSFVFEVPSGAWADTVDRRRLLVLSAAIYAAAFAAWVVFPSYPGFAAGFVLWGISGALMSGTFEALLYDELAARAAAPSYARLVGFAESAAMAAVLVAIVAAAPLYAAGGYALVGWISVAVAAVHGLLAWSLPRAPVVDRSGATVRRYGTMLRSGLVEATRERTVRRVLLLSSVLIGLTAYDEYFAVIAREHGAPTAGVPLFVGLATFGQLVGTALAGRSARLAPSTLAAIVAASAVLLSLGTLGGHVAGFAAIAAGYGLINNAMIVGEARLQDAIRGPARATVMSASGVTVEVAALALYATVGVGSTWASVTVLVALLGVPTLLVAAAVHRWMPADGEGRVPDQASDDDSVSTIRSS
jgi:MFS family permease